MYICTQYLYSRRHPLLFCLSAPSGFSLSAMFEMNKQKRTDSIRVSPFCGIPVLIAKLLIDRSLPAAPGCTDS